MLQKVGIVGKVVQQLGMGSTHGTAPFVCDGLRHQPTALSLNCQSLGSQLVHLVKLNLSKHPLSASNCLLFLYWSAYLHTYDTCRQICLLTSVMLLVSHLHATCGLQFQWRKCRHSLACTLLWVLLIYQVCMNFGQLNQFYSISGSPQ